MKTSILLGVMVFSLLAGCSNARYVMKDPSQGIVAMAHPSDGNWEKARELMTQHFPDGYTVVKEEEVPVGVSTHVHQHKTGSKSIVTRDKTEYLVHYVNLFSDKSVSPAANQGQNDYQQVAHQQSAAHDPAEVNSRTPSEHRDIKHRQTSD